MNTATIIRAALFGLTALLLTSGNAFAGPELSAVNLCVGDTVVIEAGDSEILTYTSVDALKNPHTGTIKMETRNAHVRGWEVSDQDGTPVWSELRPNNTLLESNIKWYGKSTVDYLRDLKVEGNNRMVIQARTEGTHTASYYATNFKTMTEVKREVKVHVRHCGASTAIDSAGDNYLCQGQVNFAKQGSRVIAGKRSMFHFVGKDTNRGYFAAQNAGRVTFQHSTPKDGPVREKVTVLKNGKGSCGFADEARLEALAGENSYLLQMCAGDTWITPFKQTVRQVSAQTGKFKGASDNITAETSLNYDGVAVRATGTGNAKVNVKFGGSDFTDAIIYVESIACD